AIHWFAPMLMEITNAVAGTSLDLHISVYVTCLCNPEEVPPIPNMDVVATTRPSVTGILRDLVTPPAPTPGKRDLDVDTKSLEMESDENAPGFSVSSRLIGSVKRRLRLLHEGRPRSDSTCPSTPADLGHRDKHFPAALLACPQILHKRRLIEDIAQVALAVSKLHDQR
ncbi:hypothetical protein L226DRAFT_583086, partial [Lentinus tigrinus ALCF2SS1-7]|uniref:uncharacterized protein n=1 Tax=Lentinus tigrinus ALCF2SS1-7 TaxID=1328758 RepID=UPI0011663CB7